MRCDWSIRGSLKSSLVDFEIVKERRRLFLTSFVAVRRMLRPFVRGVGRGTAIHTRSRSFNRRIHSTPTRTIDDDPDKPKVSTELEGTSSEQPATTTNESRATDDASHDPSLTERVREIRESSDKDDLPRRQRQRKSNVEEQQQQYNINSSRPPQLEEFTDEDPLTYKTKIRDLSFRERQQERFSKLKETVRTFDITDGSIHERRAAYKKGVHDTRQKEKEEANQRGKEIIDMINKRRAEKGEEPVGGLALREEQEERNRGRENRSGGMRDGEGRNRGGLGGRFGDRRLGARGRGGGRRGYDREEERIHDFHPSFNPSESEWRGFDEVDMELGYELPESRARKDKDDRPYFILSRDGNIDENRKTNRDLDVVADDDISMSIDLKDLGAIGPSYYHFKYLADKYPGSKVAKEALEDMKMTEDDLREKNVFEGEGSESDAATKRPRFDPKQLADEDKESDLQELWNIKTEIETEGLPSDVRHEFRTERLEEKRDIEYYEQRRDAAGYLGNWDKRVPLPQKHKPETANLLDYVPPTLTHDSFRFGIPALPVGTQGRLRAAHSVMVDDEDIVLPSDPSFSTASFTEAEIQDFEKSKDEIAALLEKVDIPSEPREKSFLFGNGKLPPVEKVEQGGKRPKDKFQKHEIENIYTEDQLAIWREMNKGSFAPKGFKYPDDFPDQTDNQEINEAQQQRDNEARLASFEIMEQLDAATLKRFRRRDEFEIRDIRRRLGLPVDNDKEIEYPEPYNRTRPDRIVPFECELILAKLLHMKPEYGSRKPKSQKTESLEAESLETESIIEASAEETALSRSRFDNGYSEKIHQAEIDHERNKPRKAPIDPTEKNLDFWRDSKTYLSSLSIRIHHLRRITQETRDRIRRHGTAEMITSTTSDDSRQLETSPSVIMDKLHQRFLVVHKTMEKLEILVTAIILGDRGPLDKAYSENYVEYHVHEDEAKEFEETALRMGYAPNSVSMDPVVTPEQEVQWQRMMRQVWKYKTQVGLEGEYRDMEHNAEDLPEPLRAAGKYATDSGMDGRMKWLKVGMLGHTLKERGLLRTGKEKEWPRRAVASATASAVPADTGEGDLAEGEKDEEGLEEEEGDEGEEMDEEFEEEEDEEGEEEGEEEEHEDEDEDIEEDEDVDDEDKHHVAEGLSVNASPGEPFSAEYTQVMERMRKSMADLDKDVSSLEESYDAFIAKHPPPPTTPTPPHQPPTQESSP